MLKTLASLVRVLRRPFSFLVLDLADVDLDLDGDAVTGDLLYGQS